MYPVPTPEEPFRANLAEFLAFLMGYIDLLLARYDAEDQQPRSNPGAIPLCHFTKRGIGAEIILWMMYQGHVEHLRRDLCPCEGRDSLKPAPSLLFLADSFFRLTDPGVVFAEGWLAAVLVPIDRTTFAAAWDSLVLGRLTPFYLKEDRIFGWGTHVLKSFRQPSVNQETILLSAQELGWVKWFDDPLPRRGQNPKVRLHDTIKDLNRRQTPRLIQFKGDGSGIRIGWEYR